LPPPDPKMHYGQYDVYGHLERVGNNIRELVNDTFKKTQLGEAVHSGKIYKNKFFRSFLFDEEIPEEIDVPIIALVDEIPFARIQDIADYLNISK